MTFLLSVLQYGLDSTDINKAQNKAGALVGKFAGTPKVTATGLALQPYNEVFGLQRFCETELICGR